MRLSLGMAVTLAALGLVGCSEGILGQKSEQDAETAKVLPDGTTRPVARPKELVEENSGVAAVQTKGVLGTTVVSLGTPSEPGLWLKTPLAISAGKGRVEYAGKRIDVQLIPIEGEPSSGSRMSLPVMQALGIPLTDLAEVQVSAI